MTAPNATTLRAYRELALGVRVNRASAILPASTVSTPYWTVAGGRILITCLIGEVTVLFDATATTVLFSAVPTVGTATNICGASASTANKEVGGFFCLDGTAITTALQSTNAGNGGGAVMRPVLVAVGTIDCVTANTNVGAAKWTLYYLPFDDGATVVAA